MRKEIAFMLIGTGGVLLLAGVLIYFSGKIPYLGNLPGDLSFGGDHYQVYIPFTTMILLSLLLTLILNLLFRQ